MKEKRAPWMKWYPADWRAEPALRMCARAARSFWVDLIGLMHEGEPYGCLVINGIAPTEKQIAAMTGDTEREVKGYLAELEQAGVFSRTEEGVIFSRRMVRDKAKADADRDNGKGGGNPTIRRGAVPKDQRIRPFKRSDAPTKTRRIFDREGGHCYWCAVPLEVDAFHVDHVIAIADGGSNDEENLVASCASCNHRRAQEASPAMVRHQYRVSVGTEDKPASDHNAQRPEARSQKPERNPSGSTRASRLGLDALPESWREWAVGEGFHDPEAEWLKFSDHWRAAPGHRGLKADWEATWRNWIRRAFDDGHRRKPADQPQMSKHAAAVVKLLRAEAGNLPGDGGGNPRLTGPATGSGLVVETARETDGPLPPARRAWGG